MNPTSLAKVIILLGIIFLITGGLIYLISALGMTRILGDILFRKDGTTIYIPIGIGILVSIILTVLFNLIIFLKK